MIWRAAVDVLLEAALWSVLLAPVIALVWQSERRRKRGGGKVMAKKKKAKGVTFVLRPTGGRS